jgi:hypothetical protein
LGEATWLRVLGPPSTGSSNSSCASAGRRTAPDDDHPPCPRALEIMILYAPLIEVVDTESVLGSNLAGRR